MRLFIAEKPSLARAIAAALPGPQRAASNSIECEGGASIVAWCVGHILEQAPPEAYDDRFKTWSLDHLPIVPTDWKLVPKERELIGNLKSLLARADRVVHAGDPDREGQLLVDEVLVHLKYKGPIDRLLISDQNLDAVRAAIASIRPNAQFRGLYESALGRQRADWLYGLNLTRLYTLLGRRGGHDSVLSVGRVQTPVLGLVVRRDLEIEAFQPKPFFIVTAGFTAAGGSFTATWKPGPSADADLDSDKRLTNRTKADAIVAAIAAAGAGVITRAQTDRKSEAPPLPYSLPSLQVEASRLLGLSAKATLDVAQALYETHRLITYPRSDCTYLPVGHFVQVPAVLRAIGTTAVGLQPLLGAVDQTARSRAWNDAKVTAHHAIIPTSLPKAGGLAKDELAIYELIARRYIAQFYPPHLFDQVVIDVEVAGEVFCAQGRHHVDEGWRATIARATNDAADAGNEERPALPPVKEGQPVTVADPKVVAKKTSPPKRFDAASLLEAMLGIARFVSDPSIKKILRETDGIGTPATQAGIIETLFARGFVEKRGRQIVSTPTGRQLILALPAIATTPDMTAVWELNLRRINDGHLALADFTARVLAQVEKLIAAAKAAGVMKAPGAVQCPNKGCSGVLTRRKGKRGDFLGCSRYPDCCGTVDVNAK